MIYSEIDTLFTSYHSNTTSEEKLEAIVGHVLHKDNFLQDISHSETNHIVICRNIQFNDEDNVLGMFCLVSNKDELSEARLKIFYLIITIRD